MHGHVTASALDGRIQDPGFKLAADVPGNAAGDAVAHPAPAAGRREPVALPLARSRTRRNSSVRPDLAVHAPPGAFFLATEETTVEWLPYLSAGTTHGELASPWRGFRPDYRIGVTGRRGP